VRSPLEEGTALATEHGEPGVLGVDLEYDPDVVGEHDLRERSSPHGQGGLVLHAYDGIGVAGMTKESWRRARPYT